MEALMRGPLQNSRITVRRKHFWLYPSATDEITETNREKQFDCRTNDDSIRGRIQIGPGSSSIGTYVHARDPEDLEGWNPVPMSACGPDGRSFLFLANSVAEVFLENDHYFPNGGKVLGMIKRSESPSLAQVEDGPLNIDRFNIQGRVVPELLNLDLVRRWICSCVARHEGCRSLLQEYAEDETIRLIDVKNYSVISASTAERYVALSYVWGPNTVPMLTKSTLPQFSSIDGLRNLAIPKTILDAIHFVRDIGQRYLWVDTLCIVQDDDTDKLPQLAIMGRIYNSACLVVVAAAGHDANAGLPGVRINKRTALQRSTTIQSINMVTAGPQLMQALEWSEWNKRGWTFQEAMLARRLLIFTEEQVYWNCRNGSCREDITCETSRNELVITHENSLWGTDLFRIPCRSYGFFSHVKEFSGRAFKENRDAYWAFVSILSSQAARFPHGFVWGHPREKLDASLLWIETDDCINTHERYLEMDIKQIIEDLAPNFDVPDECRELDDLPCLTAKPGRFPSWSWLSTGARISFVSPCAEMIVPRVQWHESTQAENSKFKQQEYFSQKLGYTSTDGFSFSTAMEQDRLLTFTAETAELNFQRRVQYITCDDFYGTESSSHDRSDQTPPTKDEEAENKLMQLLLPKWTLASIHRQSKEPIGHMMVPESFFNGKDEQIGEVILLSSNREFKYDDETLDQFHAEHNDQQGLVPYDTCTRVTDHNVMLIKWNNGVARRIGLGIVDNGEWSDIDIDTKVISLG